MIAGQLALDLDATRVSSREEIEARIRARVVEPDMSSAEAIAAVNDALERLGLNPVAAKAARPCICEHPQVFIDGFADERRCNLCGREPRR